MTKRQREKARGFTLIELMVVVVIILILARLTFPVLHGFLERAHNVTCVNHLQQLGFAFMAYLSDNNNYFPGSGKFGTARRDQWIQCPGASGTPCNLDTTSAIFPYVKNTRTFVCPLETTRGGAGVSMSYSMNHNFEFIHRNDVLNGDLGRYVLLLEQELPLDDAAAVIKALNPAVNGDFTSDGSGGVGKRHFEKSPLLFADGHVDLLRTSKTSETTSEVIQCDNNAPPASLKGCQWCPTCDGSTGFRP